MSGVALTLPWIAQAVGGDLRGPADRPVADVVTDSRAIGSGDAFVALSGPDSTATTSWRPPSSCGAAGAVVSRQWAEGHADVAARGSVIVVDEPLARAAGAGTRHPAGRDDAGGGDHRQRRQDDHQGADGRGTRAHLHRREEQGEPEQPHRPAALDDAAAPRARRGRVRAGHESRGRDSHARRDCRAGSPRLDQRGRRPPGLFRVQRRDRRREGRDPRGRRRVYACSCARPTTRASPAAAAVSRPHRDLRRVGRCQRARHRGRGPRARRHSSHGGDRRRPGRVRDAAAWARQSGQRARCNRRRHGLRRAARGRCATAWRAWARPIGVAWCAACATTSS